MIDPFDMAAAALAEAELGLRRGTVREAAERSWGYTSGRYTLAEMEQQIAAIRAADYDSPTAQTQGSRARSGDQTGSADAGDQPNSKREVA